MAASTFSLTAGLARLVTTLWVGGLVGVGYLAVPVLFGSLDDRALAGSLAGEMFDWLALLGFAFGIVLLACDVILGRGRPSWRAWVIGLMVVLTAVGEFQVTPAMEALKLQGISDGTAAARDFARLHGISAVLYMGTVVLGLVVTAVGWRRNWTGAGN